MTLVAPIFLLFIWVYCKIRNFLDYAIGKAKKTKKSEFCNVELAK